MITLPQDYSLFHSTPVSRNDVLGHLFLGTSLVNYQKVSNQPLKNNKQHFLRCFMEPVLESNIKKLAMLMIDSNQLDERKIIRNIVEVTFQDTKVQIMFFCYFYALENCKRGFICRKNNDASVSWKFQEELCLEEGNVARAIF